MIGENKKVKIKQKKKTEMTGGERRSVDGVSKGRRGNEGRKN